MRIIKDIKQRFMDELGAVTEEYTFLVAVALAIVGLLLTFLRVGPLTGLLTKLFVNLFEQLISGIAGLIG